MERADSLHGCHGYASSRRKLGLQSVGCLWHDQLPSEGDDGRRSQRNVDIGVRTDKLLDREQVAALGHRAPKETTSPVACNTGGGCTTGGMFTADPIKPGVL